MRACALVNSHSDNVRGRGELSATTIACVMRDTYYTHVAYTCHMSHLELGRIDQPTADEKRQRLAGVALGAGRVDRVVEGGVSLQQVEGSAGREGDEHNDAGGGQAPSLLH